ncbi:hypothetical protein [Streptomyces sp. NBC_01205]|uniref:hypothetical protein n=1 Tax=Streptomyces sp. NBC_01205 TaxID=2903771 RepID=UPI002E1024E0|nr:hypothetical protein OG573_43235 [Streptomyces sp. NBC_01205]
MLIQATFGHGMLHKLELSRGAQDLLSALIELQEPGGEVRMSQQELAARVGLGKNAASTAMASLVDRHLVLRPENSYRTYILHPYIAGYETLEDLAAAVQEAARRIQDGTLGEPSAPRYATAPPKRQHRELRAVSGA